METVLQRLRWPLTALVLLALALAISWTTRVALADYALRQDNISSLELALHLTPDQAAIHTRLASLIEAEDPNGAMTLLERAVSLNPWDTSARIRLGLHREAAGDLNGAVQDLLEAARHDRLYLPRWTLANHYFRRGDTAHFWQWAGAAAEMVYDDGTALFRLCGGVQEDGRLIERLNIRRPDIRAYYLGYLLRAQRFDVVMPAVRTLLADRRPADVELLLNTSDRLIDRNFIPDAIEIWNSLSSARRIPFEALAPEQGRVLTNSKFLTRPTSHGFDWHSSEASGITAGQEGALGGWRATFSGQQPEHCEILAQLLPLPQNSELELTVAYRTADITPPSGLELLVADAANGAIIAAADNLCSEEGEIRTLRFRTPAVSRLARLSVCYHRAVGTARIDGYLTIREVGLRLATRLSKTG